MNMYRTQVLKQACVNTSKNGDRLYVKRRACLSAYEEKGGVIIGGPLVDLLEAAADFQL